jgi:nucleoside-diphosphate-sugar epimerase
VRTFVTGASGYIGLGVAAALARAGHEVVGLVRDAGKARRLAAAGVEAVVGDMAAPQAWIGAARECAASVHCAAEYTERFHDLDRRTTEALLRAAREAGGPRTFLYTSGCWVLGDTGDRVADETAPTNPPAFVAPRVETERLVLAADAGPVRTLVVRPACVYGGSGSLTASWFGSAARDGAATVLGDGAQRWAMVHLDDLADLYVRALESTLRGEVLHAADGSRATVRECAEAASRAAGRGGAVRLLPLAEAVAAFGPSAHCMAMTQRLDASKAARLLGWHPRHAGFVDEARLLHLAWRASAEAAPR